MTKEEVDNLLDVIFPVGEERWVKLKYYDRDKCIDALRLSPPNEETKKEFIEKYGYEVTALGVRPENEPILQMMAELKQTLISASYYKTLSSEDIKQIMDIYMQDYIDKITVTPIRAAQDFIDNVVNDLKTLDDENN